MKVGLFIDSYHPKINGVITSVDTLKAGLEKLGHEVLIITGGSNIEIKKSNGIIELPSIDLTPWNTRVISPYNKKNKEIIRKEKFDIVHSHTPFFTGLLATSIAKEERIPNIHSYHTFCDKYKDYVLHNFAHSGDFIINSINNIFCGKNIDELIVPSEELKEYLQETGKTNQEINVIPTGFILENFINHNPKQIEEKRIKYEISDKDFVLMYVGRLGKEKNISFIIENHKEIIKFNDNIKLLIVGDGPEYIKEKKKIEDQNLERKIIFTGKINHNNIPEFYHLANLMVTASTTETQGLCIGESLACSLPVCCIKSKVFESTVIEDYNGTYFQTEEEYVNKIIHLSAHPEIVKRWKNAPITTIKTEVHYAQEVEKIYQKARQEKREKE